MFPSAIKIGALYPLSGANEYIGQRIYKALEFLVDMINNETVGASTMGINLPDLKGRKIELVWADTESDPSIGLNEARRLIHEEKVTSIIGSYESSVTEAVSLLTEVEQIPYLSPDTNAAILSKRELHWFFKTGTDDVTYTKAIFALLLEKGFFKADLGFLSENTALGQGESQALINLAHNYDFKVTSLNLYNPLTADIKDNLLPLKTTNPDFLFSGQLTKEALKTVNALAEIQYYPKGFFSQTSEYTLREVLDKAGTKANYIISAVPWALGVTKKNPMAKEINTRFKLAFGSDLDAVNAASFTGLYVLLDAISRSHEITAGAIREALLETNIPGYNLIMPWKGVAFNHQGKNIYATALLVQIYDNSLPIIWPKDYSETKPVLPVPTWQAMNS